MLKNKLPGVVDLVKNFTKLDVTKDLIPVSPSAHYTMGGIPCDLDCYVTDGDRKIEGLMAVGESACVSVHGANRLGCNSLLDLVVFGKIAGQKAAKVKLENSKILEKITQYKINKLAALLQKNFGEKNVTSLAEIKTALQKNNEKNLGVFRDEEALKEGLVKLKELFAIFKKYQISSKNLAWNEELIGYLELENLFLNSLAANFSALNRKESRGAHYRDDFKERNDEFLCHSLVKMESYPEKLEMRFSKKAMMVQKLEV